MAGTNVELLLAITAHLEDLTNEFVFVGGCATSLLITDEAATGARLTTDVDGIVDVLNYAQMVEFESRLTGKGFHRVLDGPICRWVKDGALLDVMPAKGDFFGFNSSWFEDAIKTSEWRKIAPNTRIRIVTPVYFLATKLEAFADRGKNDFLGSRDLEDIITVINGRDELIDEIRRSELKLKTFVTASFGRLLNTSEFLQALPGHMNSEPDRLSIVLERIRNIAEIT